MRPENRDKTGKVRPGCSGNPGGRPASSEQVRDLAQQQGAEAIQRLVELMRSKDERVSLAACNALLDRGFGKPLQTAELSGVASPVGFVLTAPWWKEVVEARGH